MATEDRSITIGFDLGGTKMHAAAVDAGGNVLHGERQKTNAGEGAEAVIDRMIGLVVRVRKELGERGSDVNGVCVGVPGGVDSEHGIVDKAPNLGWTNVPLAQKMSTVLGIPVFLDNDVRVAVIGEHVYGVGRGAQTMVGIFVGTGIGGGVIVGGKVHHGGRGVAGEIGHMTLLPRGPRCGCGRRGCVEALASRTAMERDVHKLIKRGWKSQVPKLMKKEGRTELSSSVLERALDLEDDVMVKVVKDAQYYLGLLTASLANLLDPEVIVIGGGIAERLGERFVAPIREHAYKHFLVQRDRDKVRVVPTQLLDRAAPLGAAHIARERIAGRSGPTNAASDNERSDSVDSAPGARHGTSSWPVPSA